MTTEKMIVRAPLPFWCIFTPLENAVVVECSPIPMFCLGVFFADADWSPSGWASAIVTLVAAAAATFFAWCQLQVSKSNFQVALLERRLKVHDSIHEFLLIVLSQDTASQDAMVKLHIETKHADFVFGTHEVTVFVEQARIKALKLNSLNREIESCLANNISPGWYLTEKRKLRDWFENEFEGLEQRFSQDLQVPRSGFRGLQERWEEWRQ